MKKFMKGSHYVGVSMWHFEWCLKYRYKMFAKFKYKNLMSGCIRCSAFEHKIKILELEVLPNHVHVVVELPGTMSLSRAMQLLKGRLHFYFLKCIQRQDLDTLEGIFGVEGNSGLRLDLYRLNRQGIM